MTAGRIILLSSTAAMLALASFALASPAVSLWFVTAAAASYLGIILAGVMTPRLAMFAPIACRATSGRAEIALTFDDGPHPTTTPKVLAELARYDARATFFVLGAKAEKHPDILRAIFAAGHEIGLHGYSHDRFLSLRTPRGILGDLRRASAVLGSLTGRTPRLFRPPVGHVSPRTAVAARRLGLAIVGWNVRARDGLASATGDVVLRRVTRGLRPGAIVLLHDAAERDDREPASLTVLSQILAEAARRGLACVTVSQALSAEAGG